MANVANVDLDLRFGTAGNEGIPTTTCDLRLVVRRMNSLFHCYFPCSCYVVSDFPVRDFYLKEPWFLRIPYV